MSPFAFIAIGQGARSIENLQLTQEADNTAADTLCLAVVKLMVGCGRHALLRGKEILVVPDTAALLQMVGSR